MLLARPRPKQLRRVRSFLQIKNLTTAVVFSKHLIFCVLLAVGVSSANYALWSTVGISAAAPDITGRLHGLTYAPYGRDEAPWVRHSFAPTAIDADLRQLAALTREIRTYSASQHPELPELAAKHGLRLTLGAWLGLDTGKNAREIRFALQAARDHANVTGLIIGNETILKKNLTLAQLIERLRHVKQRSNVPISTAEPWHVWIKHPELADEVDFITVHLLPFWEGVAAEDAVDASIVSLGKVQARFPGKRIVIGEVGYPSQGESFKQARPSPSAQALFVRQFARRAEQQRLEYFFIEAFDQPWKLAEEGRAGPYWGLFDAARQAKFSLSGAVLHDQHWQHKALASSLTSMLFLTCFLAKLVALRRWAKVAFAVAVQAVISLAVVAITQPLSHYLSMSEWVMTALLLLTSAVMVAILIAHLFEFVEIFWDGSLKRRFALAPLQQSAALPADVQPMVSIHLACSNEAPDVVIATLQSLQALDYEAFEVLVVVNNTVDPALWQPVRDAVANLPANFRFFHLPTWPGFKAGALNFALTHTHADAQVIGVVDADYVVRANWLRSSLGHFNRAEVGVVQAPQAHRSWQNHALRRAMNWEYEGFFRIGMHHRNERNAIIQHGTMTLVRASALREHGRWSPWCLCEDAELGLRLMQHQWHAVYVDAVMGEGLTPDGFGAFKRQRQRWAQGGMQIFKAHWRTLLRVSSAPAVAPLGDPHERQQRLTMGQRYHFLAGWLPWLGDALHLVFVLAAVAWTWAVLALPEHFALPFALFMLPLAMFCITKLVIGPLLYWRRVPCNTASAALAAVAGMALSHGIARGVWAGLFQGEGEFKVTAKGGQKSSSADWSHRGRAALSPVQEECLLLSALLVAIAAVGWVDLPGQWESALWMGMLTLQGLPYAAAVTCALVSEFAKEQAVVATVEI